MNKLPANKKVCVIYDNHDRLQGVCSTKEIAEAYLEHWKENGWYIGHWPHTLLEDYPIGHPKRKEQGLR